MSRFQFSHGRSRYLPRFLNTCRNHIYFYFITSDENETCQICFIFPNVLRFYNSNGLAWVKVAERKLETLDGPLITGQVCGDLVQISTSTVSPCTLARASSAMYPFAV